MSESRIAVIKSAMPLYQEKGALGVSLQDVAETLHMPLADLQAEFVDDAGLLDAAWYYFGPDYLTDYLDDMLLECETTAPATCLANVARTITEHWIQQESRQSVTFFFENFSLLDQRYDLDRSIASAKGRLAEAFEVWRQDGWLKKDADGVYLSWAFFAPFAANKTSLWLPTMSDAHVQAGCDLLDKHVALFLDMWVHETPKK